MRVFRLTWLLPLLPALLLGLCNPAIAAPEEAESKLPITDVRTFAEVFERIKRAYVEEVDDTMLLRNAMRGMLSELDPHSAYLSSEDFEALRESTEGEFGGIGIEVGMQDSQLTIIAPLDGTPAAEAGLQARDIILRIDDTPTERMSLQEAVTLMRGEPGEDIQLTILRNAESAPRTYTLTREIIQSDSVKSELLEPGYGYLRISQFQSRTGQQVRDALAKLAEQSPLKGLILDLRNNPGGVLNGAVEVADAFLDSGLIVYTEGRLDDSDLRFAATPGTGVSVDVPMVVLINGGSASAAEIVAGALQDQRRAVIMGTPSFGKGSVQQVLPLANGDGLKLTTALYYTPSGRSIQAQGISPDVRVVRGRLEVAEGNDFGLRESDLAGRLANPNGTPEPRVSSDPLQDYQLNEALNLLKALNVLERLPVGADTPAAANDS